MSATNPEQKVRAALLKSAEVQAARTPNPRERIEASQWQLFFELPLDRLMQIRDKALAADAASVVANMVADDDEQAERVAED